MIRKLLKMLFSISPILCASPFLYFVIDKTINQNREDKSLVNKINNVNFTRTVKQKITNYYEILNQSTNVTLSNETKNILQDNAYSWEIPYILNYECDQKLKYNNSLITKELFKIKNSIISGYKRSESGSTVTQQFSVNDLYLYQINTIYLSDSEASFDIYLSDSQNNILKLNYETLLQFKKTTPSTKVLLNGDYSDTNPSDISNNVVIKTEFLQKIIVYTTYDEYGYRVLPFNNNNDQMKKFYSNGTTQVPTNQPSKRININSSNDSDGTIGLNIVLESNNDFFPITGFDSQGIPFNFGSSNSTNDYSFNYNLVTRLPKESKPWIFRGDDGNFLMWTIISASILVFINILAIIIYHVGQSKKEYRIYKRNLHKVINNNAVLENRNLSNSRLAYDNVRASNNSRNQIGYSNPNRNKNIR